MRKNIIKPLRFCVDRMNGQPFVRQLADAIREAIASGYYRDGDVLPPLAELARTAEVSIIVPREAIGILSREGLVVPRRGLGSVVNAPHGDGRLGHVVLVGSELSDNYFVRTVKGIMRSELLSAGYRVSQVSVTPGMGRRPDFAQLDLVLSGAVSLAVVLSRRWGIAGRVSKSGVPFIAYANDRTPLVSNRVGDLRIDHSTAIADFVNYCRMRNVRTVEEIVFDGWHPRVEASLRAAGIGVRLVELDSNPRDVGASCGVEQGMFKAMMSRIRGDRRAWPDLFFFDDDYALRGSVTAILSAGLKIPKDVRLAAYGFYGNLPVVPFDLTRIEEDPWTIGAGYAQYILSVLAGVNDCQCPDDGVRFVKGSSM